MKKILEDAHFKNDRDAKSIRLTRERKERESVPARIEVIGNIFEYPDLLTV